MKEVKRIERFADGLIAKGINDKGAECRESITEVRAAIIPPARIHGGYYLAMGQKYESSVKGKGPLSFITEGTAATTRELFHALSDDITRMKVSKVYLDFGKEGFFRQVYNNFSGSVSIHPAPFVADIEYGVTMIQEYLSQKAIEIPPAKLRETILRAQLESAADGDDIGFAIDALRFIVGGFEKDPTRKTEYVQLTESAYYYD